MSTIALLFPGQGSQEAGMGRDLAESQSEIMDFWKTAERSSGIPLREIYWDGDEAAMANTKNLQPALTVTNIAFWMFLSKHTKPNATAGHSLGEYSSLAAAKVLPIQTIIELVALRGRLMSSADPSGTGAMAAIVKLDQATVEACVAETHKATGELIRIANYNTPNQFVVSGTKTAIEYLQPLIKDRKGRAVPLSVSGAFHSPLMKEAAQEMTQALNAISKTAWNNAAFPVYCNTTGKPETDAMALKEQLSQQMTSSVYWISTITNQWDAGIRSFVECGPKGVLTRMISPILDAYEPSQSANNIAPAWTTHQVSSLQQAQEYIAD